MGQSNWVHLEDCAIKRVTDKVVLLCWDTEDYWIPLSHVSDPDSLEEGDEGITVSITEWIAKQKGIEFTD